MTSIFKKCLLAAFVAAGMLATSGSASAAFTFTYTPVSANAGAFVSIINTATPAGPTNFTSFVGVGPGLPNGGLPPDAPVLLFNLADPGGGSRTLSIGYNLFDDPTTATLRTNNNPNGGITIVYNGTASSAPIEFRLEIMDTGATIPVALGNNLTASGTFSVFGGTDQPQPVDFATASTIQPQATLSGQNPNPVVLSVNTPPGMFTGPVPPGTVILTAGGLGAPPLNVNFTRVSNGTTTRLFADIRLNGYTNTTIFGSLTVVQNIVPAPAGLLLAGLGLPALGLAARLRRKVAA